MQCFCPNARFLLTNDGSPYGSDEEEIEDPSNAKSEDLDRVYVDGFDFVASCQNLMVQSVQEDSIEDKGQRWNIFQTQCQTNESNCKLIIDTGTIPTQSAKNLMDSIASWKHPQPPH